MDKIKGQGAKNNVYNRFEKFQYEKIMEEPADSIIKTDYVPVFAKTIVNSFKSIDLPFTQSMNPYQGCEHGCSYCYARPTHEYWSLNAGVDFERKILYKPNAPELLEKHFQKKNYVPSTISLSGNTDCYQPIEKKFNITRDLLKILVKYRHPVSIITKNALILRDLDLLQELRAYNLVSVAISITSLDENLRRILEPRTSTYELRLRTVKTLADNHIPVIGMIAPIIPSINSDEIFAIAQKLAENGADSFGHTIINLNDATEIIFKEWLFLHFPDRAEKVLNHIHSLYHGNAGSKKWGERMTGSGKIVESIHQICQIAKTKYFPKKHSFVLNTNAFIKPSLNNQLSLFN